jgi:hypothetical protein
VGVFAAFAVGVVTCSVTAKEMAVGNRVGGVSNADGVERTCICAGTSLIAAIWIPKTRMPSAQNQRRSRL